MKTKGFYATIPSIHTGVERRFKPRVYGSFPAKVRGINSAGDSFEVTSLLDNVSATGLYVTLTQNVEHGTKLFVVFRLSTSPDYSEPAATVAIKGPIIRVEPLPDGMWGVAVAITNYHFIYVSNQARS